MCVSICFEFDKFFFVFFCFVFFGQVLLIWRRKKGGKKKKWWAVLVMFTWIDWNLTWKFNQSSVLMQNNDNFKQLLFCKKSNNNKKELHLTPVCSGLVLQAHQQAPKGCHQLQGMRSCSDFHAGTLSALLQMKPCSLEPRFNRANKWNHSTSCSPQHITFRDSSRSWKKWKNKM